MMQNFRARSDILVGQYEDEDEVQHSISDTSDGELEETTGKKKPTKYVCWNNLYCNLLLVCGGGGGLLSSLDGLYEGWGSTPQP